MLIEPEKIPTGIRWLDTLTQGGMFCKAMSSFEFYDDPHDVRGTLTRTLLSGGYTAVKSETADIAGAKTIWESWRKGPTLVDPARFDLRFIEWAFNKRPPPHPLVILLDGSYVDDSPKSLRFYLTRRISIRGSIAKVVKSPWDTTHGDSIPIEGGIS